MCDGHGKRRTAGCTFVRTARCRDRALGTTRRSKQNAAVLRRGRIVEEEINRLISAMCSSDIPLYIHVIIGVGGSKCLGKVGWRPLIHIVLTEACRVCRFVCSWHVVVGVDECVNRVGRCAQFVPGSRRNRHGYGQCIGSREVAHVVGMGTFEVSLNHYGRCCRKCFIVGNHNVVVHLAPHKVST